jgi:putative flippase GtrA
LRRLVTFGAVSVAATIVDFGLFNILLTFQFIPLLVATTLAYTLGMITSYGLNRRYTFDGGRDSRVHEIGIFISISLVGLALNNGTVALFAALIGRGRLTLNLARVLAAALTWSFKFVTIQQWVFPTRDSGSRVPTEQAEQGRTGLISRPGRPPQHPIHDGPSPTTERGRPPRPRSP